jgi:type IX secretion system PorP/SprF family membrane protein
MRKILSIIALSVISLIGEAQQLWQFTQFTDNSVGINPALATQYNGINASLTARNQWMGYDNAPRTIGVIVQSKIGRRNQWFNPSLRTSGNAANLNKNRQENYTHTIGGMIYLDSYGVINNTYGDIYYALSKKIKSDLRISAGIGVGVSSMNIDVNEITFTTSSDPTVNSMFIGGTNSLILALRGGLAVHSNNFSAGYSTFYLSKDVITINNAVGAELLRNHHSVYGDYTFELNEKLDLKPGLWVKYVRSTPINAQLNAILGLQKSIYFGLGYRLSESLSGILAYKFQEKISLGYSYDFVTNNLGNYQSGSHELNLRYGF